MDEDRMEQTNREMAESTEGTQPTDALNTGGTAGSETEEQARQAKTEADAKEMAAEINRLADALTRALKATWQSEQRRQLQDDLSKGLRSLVDRVEHVLTDFSESEQGQEVREQAERVVERVRSSKVAADLQKGLTEGLRTVAEEMQEFAERMEKRAEDEKPVASAEAQDIEVQVEDENGQTKEA